LQEHSALHLDLAYRGGASVLKNKFDARQSFVDPFPLEGRCFELEQEVFYNFDAVLALRFIGNFEQNLV